MAARTRLIVVWGLFAAWVAWLAWQSINYGRFPVVSHSQFLNVDVAVIGEINAGLTSPMKIESVVWTNGEATEAAGTEIEIVNLAEVDRRYFAGPGRYVIPLARLSPTQYRVAGVPRSPQVDPARHRPLIYPATEIVMRQVQDIPRRRANN